MKMLEMPEYALFEIHEFGERRLGPEEKPLLGKVYIYLLPQHLNQTIFKDFIFNTICQ